MHPCHGSTWLKRSWDQRERERESEGERFMGQGGGVLLPCHVASVQEGESESCSVMSDSL